MTEGTDKNIHSELGAIVSEMLVGSQLEKFSVGGPVVCLLFANYDAAPRQEFWLNFSGFAHFSDREKGLEQGSDDLNNTSFHQSRRELISELYDHFALEVQRAEISHQGELSVHFSAMRLTIPSIDMLEPSDAIWALSDFHPSRLDDAKWVAALYNDGFVSMRKPGWKNMDAKIAGE